MVILSIGTKDGFDFSLYLIFQIFYSGHVLLLSFKKTILKKRNSEHFIVRVLFGSNKRSCISISFKFHLFLSIFLIK